MSALQLTRGPGVSLFIALRHRLRIAATGIGVAALMGFSLLPSMAHADEASLEDLVMDPTASISVGSLKFDNFNLLQVAEPGADLHVEVSGITHPDGETGIRFIGDYAPFRFDMMLFTVTTTDPFSLLHDMTIAFDADPLNPDEDTGYASVWAIAWRMPALSFRPASSGIMLCTQGAYDFDICGSDNNRFINRTTFFDPPPGAPIGWPTGTPANLPQVQVQVEVANNSAGPAPTGFRNVDITFSQVPEPSTFLLLATATGIAFLLSSVAAHGLAFTKNSRRWRCSSSPLRCCWERRESARSEDLRMLVYR